MQDITRGLHRLAELMIAAGQTAITEEAETIMTVAKERTPVETGNLRGSGRVVPSGEGIDFSVALVFGNEAVDYAVYVHYNLEAHHDHGQALFLSSAIDEARPGMDTRVANRIERILRDSR